MSEKPQRHGLCYASLSWAAFCWIPAMSVAVSAARPSVHGGALPFILVVLASYLVVPSIALLSLLYIAKGWLTARHALAVIGPSIFSAVLLAFVIDSGLTVELRDRPHTEIGLVVASMLLGGTGYLAARSHRTRAEHSSGENLERSGR